MPDDFSLESVRLSRLEGQARRGRRAVRPGGAGASPPVPADYDGWDAGTPSAQGSDTLDGGSPSAQGSDTIQGGNP